MQSNRDYATEILNLHSKIEQLEKENQELKEKLEDAKNKVLQVNRKNNKLEKEYETIVKRCFGCNAFTICRENEKLTKGIEILKRKVTFRWRNDQILEIVKYPWAKKTPKIAIMTNYEEDELLKEILGE